MPDADQEFAVVKEMLGNGRALLHDAEGASLIGRIRGSMRRSRTRVLIERGDLVVVARWDFEEGKGDIVHKYTHEEATLLSHRGDLPASIVRAIAAQDPTLSNVKDDDDNEIMFINDEVDLLSI
jgi:translation initiation factor 1A